MKRYKHTIRIEQGKMFLSSQTNNGRLCHQCRSTLDQSSVMVSTNLSKYEHWTVSVCSLFKTMVRACHKLARIILAKTGC